MEDTETRKFCLERALELSNTRNINDIVRASDKFYQYVKYGSEKKEKTPEKSDFLKFVHQFYDENYVEEKWMSQIIFNMLNPVEARMRGGNEFTLPRRSGVSTFLSLLFLWMKTTHQKTAQYINPHYVTLVIRSKTVFDTVSNITKQNGLTFEQEPNTTFHYTVNSMRGKCYNYIICDDPTQETKEAAASAMREYMVVVNTR